MRPAAELPPVEVLLSCRALSCQRTAGMVDKSELVAFEREKRLYKDAYVENFRSVRYFPSLATIGAGRTDCDSIVLVQEPQVPVAERTSPKDARSRLDDAASRLIPPDSLEEIFDTTLPLTKFRSAIMCKHSKARQERRAAEAVSSGGSASMAGLASRYRGHSSAPGVFKPTSVVEAKGAIQRKVTYDGQPFQDKPRSMRSVTPRTGAPLPWATNNPANARKEICGRTFFNVPPEGSIKADRKYTQEFIRLSMEAYHAGRRHTAKSDKGYSRHDH
ncbi:hypothetical protein PC129_g12498 [Phytophthora cactorum]|nr:hypothetical protein PC114_g15474 [Phytophthora cactorum]KAG3216664.1 hypothetical protein PC129_g12498 [Phytophthora cactorum]KAG4050226.1 hypothetical protein PC123_g14521 [Phytophthora cactorum]KAG4234099.1 hypothetical protein PC116_g17736 [Phytophthora cactorum]